MVEKREKTSLNALKKIKKFNPKNVLFMMQQDLIFQLNY